MFILITVMVAFLLLIIFNLYILKKIQDIYKIINGIENDLEECIADIDDALGETSDLYNEVNRLDDLIIENY